MSTPAPNWIHDTRDDIQLVRAIHAWAAKRPAALVCQIAPSATRRAEVVWDLLHALGKRADLPGTPQSPAWIDAERWLVARQVTQLIVLRAQHLDRDSSEELTALAGQLGMELWLITHGPHPPLEGIPARKRPLTALFEPPHARVAHRARRSYPAIPECHPFLFRAHCAALVAPNELLRRIDRLLDHVARATDQWLAMHQDATPEDMRALVCLTAASADPGRTCVRLRGLQRFQ
jgi:hypothetical protein